KLEEQIYKDTKREITSGQISKVIQRSQQTASKILIELEKDNLIERIKNNKRFKIKVTQEGFEVIKELHCLMKTAIDSSRGKRVIFKGKIVTGMGEGSYYMSKKGYKDQFREKLGYEPFPGTLNIKLEEQIYKDTKREITKYPSIYIHGFKDENRTFGWVKCYPTILTPEAKENDNIWKNNKKYYEKMEIESSILLLERTHHNNSLVEVISPVCIKETASLKNGDIVTIELKDLN
ncbi:MAG: CTP-dependent riboflavin kinase, partial [Thermoproteota archaeon]|nr:CTP-dependent riboflavin kinase [Thermoproteota archaeon]